MTTLKNILAAAAMLVIFSNITHAQTLKANYTVKKGTAKFPFLLFLGICKKKSV